MPVLIIGGSQDTVLSPQEHEALAAALPRARLELEQGVGHALHCEEPEEFVRKIRRFLDEGGGGNG